MYPILAKIPYHKPVNAGWQGHIYQYAISGVIATLLAKGQGLFGFLARADGIDVWYDGAGDVSDQQYRKQENETE